MALLPISEGSYINTSLSTSSSASPIKQSFSLDTIESADINLSFDARDQIGLSENLWNNNLTGNNITVAVLDTGIYANHSVFTNDGFLNWSDRIIAFYDEDLNGESDNPNDVHWHGTWAASILGGNSSEYTGVAPSVNFVILRLFYELEGEVITSLSILENAIDWIIQNKDKYNIKIASMSFGTTPSPNNLAIIDEMNMIVEELVHNGILAVAAAGN